MAEVKSPCKKICKLVKRQSNGEKFCLGCGRTKEEIKNWKTSNNEYKLQVLERLKVQS